MEHTYWFGWWMFSCSIVSLHSPTLWYVAKLSFVKSNTVPQLSLQELMSPGWVLLSLHCSECLSSIPHAQAYVKMSLLNFMCATTCMCAHSHTQAYMINAILKRFSRQSESSLFPRGMEGTTEPLLCPGWGAALSVKGGSSSSSECSFGKDMHRAGRKGTAA